MERATATASPYRWHAFTHSLNLAFLAAAGLAGALIDPIVWLVAAPLEIGAIWAIPDLPGFRQRVDRLQRAKEIHRERLYYLDQLWDIRPTSKSLLEGMLGWFVEVDEEDPSPRANVRDTAFAQYTEMRQILRKLADLEKVRGAKIVSQEILRFEEVINGFLRYQIACRSLGDVLGAVNAAHLRRDLEEIDEQLKGASADLRLVLLERRRLRESQLERLPKLQATLELFRTRADTVVYQMRNFHGQVVADPGADINSFLEEMVEKHELLVDPLGELEADQTVRDLLRAAQTERDPKNGSRLPPIRGVIRQG